MSSRRAVLGLAAAAATQLVLADRRTAMAAASDPGFRVEISNAGNALRVDYLVENTTGRPVFVTNKIWRSIDGKPKIDPDFVYSTIVDGGLLAVSKTMPGIPSDKSPTNLVAPYMTRLDPGQQLSETINLALPVQTYLEYFDNTAAKDDNGEPVIITAAQAVFSLGYFLPPDGSRMWKEKAFGTEVDLFHNPPGARAAYGVLSSPKARLSIPVFKRAMS